MTAYTYTTSPPRKPTEPEKPKPTKAWLIPTAAIPALGTALVPGGPGWQGALVLAVFAAAVGAWVLTSLDDTWIALAAVAVLAVAGILAPADLFATLGADLVWLLIAAFVLAAGLTGSGLVDRFVAMVPARARSVRGLAHLSTVALVVSSLVVPSTSGRAALAVPVFTALAGALPRMVKALSVLFPTVVLLSAVSTLIGAGAHLVADQLLREATGDGIGFLRWLLLGLPLAVVSSHLAAEVVLRLFTTREDRRERFDLRAEFPPRGPWTRTERFAAVTIGAVLVLWCTEPWHGLPPALVGLVGALAMCVPPHRVTTGTALKTVPWSLLLFTAATAALGGALVASGAAAWVADVALSPVRGAPAWVVLMAVIVVSTAAHLAVQSRSARSSVLVPVVIPLAAATGLAPAAAVFASTAAAGFCHTLTSSAKPVALFSGIDGVPTYSSSDLLRLSKVLAPLHVVVVAVFALLVWPHFGLSLIP
ncbi:transporter [Amycolatopsis sp. WAC 04169]|uniref:SLC13 family permease n=1 Tax=Amycolatopsis sp. WAC 04169 TaxID=2203197 RepID=UPI000F7A3788|nr:SLC13 family permease [Amycolatopsis sp. WAC 04169]RSN29947.1 transporter [Amycolatopsis sp. WAC 04169]